MSQKLEINYHLEAKNAKGNSSAPTQLNLLKRQLKNPVNLKEFFYKLAKRISWNEIEDYSADLYGYKGKVYKTDPVNGDLAHLETALQPFPWNGCITLG